jgi:hypothetical protein
VNELIAAISLAAAGALGLGVYKAMCKAASWSGRKARQVVKEGFTEAVGDVIKPQIESIHNRIDTHMEAEEEERLVQAAIVMRISDRIDHLVETLDVQTKMANATLDVVTKTAKDDADDKFDTERWRDRLDTRLPPEPGEPEYRSDRLVDRGGVDDHWGGGPGDGGEAGS